jgi:Flp pilus assembly protein TadD
MEIDSLCSGVGEFVPPRGDAMQFRRFPAFAAICFVFAVVPAFAQGPGGAAVGGNATALSNIPMNGTAGIEPLMLSVVNEKLIRLDRPATVKVISENTKQVEWQTSKGEIRFEDLGPGKYEVEVSALGYLSTRKEVQLLGESRPVHVQIVLHPDPDAVTLSGADEGLPPKASKEVEKGISDLQSEKPKDAQKHFENACKIAPDSARTNFLLGYALFQQNDFGGAQSSLAKAVAIDPKNVQALNLLGRLRLARHDFAGAKTTLQTAIGISPENPTAHAFLADAYLNLADYKSALAETDLAIEKGASKATNVQIVRGEALADMGRDEEAIEALNDYLKLAPDSPAAPQVRQLIGNIEQRRPSAQTALPAKTQ